MIKQEKKAKNLRLKRCAIFMIIGAFVLSAIAPIASMLI